jgi:hypothetical protein
MHKGDVRIISRKCPYLEIRIRVRHIFAASRGRHADLTGPCAMHRLRRVSRPEQAVNTNNVFSDMARM